MAHIELVFVRTNRPSHTYHKHIHNYVCMYIHIYIYIYRCGGKLWSRRLGMRRSRRYRPSSTRLRRPLKSYLISPLAIHISYPAPVASLSQFSGWWRDKGHPPYHLVSSTMCAHVTGAVSLSRNFLLISTFLTRHPLNLQLKGRRRKLWSKR